MFVYVLDHDQWIETESLFPHDIALLIDNKAKKAYLWFGDRSDEALRDKAQQLATEMMKKYTMYELIVLGTTVPMKIEAEIENLLGENADPTKLKIARTKAMIYFVYLGYAGIIALLAVVINNIRMLFWDSVDDSYVISSWLFNNLFDVSVIISIIVVVIFGVQFILGLLSQKTYLVVSALACAGVALGMMFYLAEGELIFEFLTGSSQETFLIRITDVLAHITWLVLIWVTCALITLYAVLAIKKTTEIKEVQKKVQQLTAKPSLLRDARVKLKEKLPTPPPAK
jgi:hypothetical protein